MANAAEIGLFCARVVMAGTRSTPALTMRQANRVRYDVYRRGGPPPHKMSDEERTARRAEYAARDRAHAAVIRAKRAGERALAKAANVAQLAAEVDRIRSEIRVGVKAPVGRIAAVDAAGMLFWGHTAASAELSPLDRRSGVEGSAHHLLLLLDAGWCGPIAESRSNPSERSGAPLSPN